MAPLPSTIAGYSVLRLLGEGRHSDIYLGHSAASATGQVALKVFRTGTATHLVEREIDALAEATSGLAGLLDVATLPDGRVCLVLERLRGCSLAHYLARYGPLTSGEAVTILAPVIVALRELHERGLVHTGLSQASIMIVEHGRPVLVGLGSLGSVPSHGPERTSLIRADYARVAVLVNGVLDGVDESQTALGGRAAIVARCEAATTAPVFTPCLQQLERHLFAWAPAAALTYGHGVRPRATGTPTTHPDVFDGSPATTADVLPGDPETGALRLRLGLPSDSAELVRHVAQLALHVRDRLTALPSRLLARRRVGSDPRSSPRRWSRVVYAAGLATAATVAALILIPAPAPDSPTTPLPGVVTTPTTSVGDEAALASDDPVPAVRVLLARRAQCLAASSLPCLELIEQPGSPLHTADGAAVAAEAAPFAFTLNADGTAELIERNGNSALIALSNGAAEAGSAGDAQSQPASALVIKGETGWRLRELFAY